MTISVVIKNQEFSMFRYAVVTRGYKTCLFDRCANKLIIDDVEMDLDFFTTEYTQANSNLVYMYKNSLNHDDNVYLNELASYVN